MHAPSIFVYLCELKFNNVQCYCMFISEFETFVSCCHNKRFSDSPSAYQEALELVQILKGKGKNPWMEVPSGDSDDHFHTNFSVLKRYGYIVIVVTRGYARSIWSLREFYYATLLNKRIFLFELEMNKLALEPAGNWLLNQLKRIMQQRRFRCVHQLAEALIEESGALYINFPLLPNIISDEQKQRSMETRLRRETREIMDQFSILLGNLEVCIRNQNFPVETLARRINRYLPKTEKFVTYEDIFTAIEEISSFFNYRLVKVIVYTIKIKELMDEFKHYEKYFTENYASKRLYQIPSSVSKESKYGHAKLVIKADLDLYEKFIHDLEDLRDKVCGIFKIEDHHLCLCKVSKGCIELDCTVSHYIKEKIFPLSSEQEQALSRLGVLCLCCEQYQYDFKQVRMHFLYLNSY